MQDEQLVLHLGRESWSTSQCIRSLRGVTLFLLTMKCVTVLRVNSSDSLLTRSLCSLLWPTNRPVPATEDICIGTVQSMKITCEEPM
ncbi:hypothetical protein NQZ68_035086 [Dissostichus eleginoides]|nr:hypothetical protein NQZ68_035086 [Dissostichus eleginoides]